jgi:hypothetical protein
MNLALKTFPGNQLANSNRIYKVNLVFQGNYMVICVPEACFNIGCDRSVDFTSEFLSMYIVKKSMEENLALQSKQCGLPVTILFF